MRREFIYAAASRVPRSCIEALEGDYWCQAKPIDSNKFYPVTRAILTTSDNDHLLILNLERM